MKSKSKDSAQQPGSSGAHATSEDVVALYREFLGREPESAEAIAQKKGRLLIEVAVELIRSEEFRSKHREPALDLAQISPHRSDAASQLQLMLTYRNLVQQGQKLPRPNEVGFKCYSQTDEDGILLFIFSLIGVTNKISVEVCAGDGLECNSVNLIINHGWHGLLVDGDKGNVERGTHFFAHSKWTYVYPPRFVCAWITRAAVNEVLGTNGFTGEIDLLSLDIDGVDYWIWESIECVSPRVVVVEYQDILGPDRAWTVPYSDDFSARNHSMTAGMPNFAGASLSAFVKLARRKGYRLVAVNRYGYNAFFVRDGLGESSASRDTGSSVLQSSQSDIGTSRAFPYGEGLPLGGGLSRSRRSQCRNIAV